MEIAFEGKVRKSGKAWIVTVPTAFIRGGTLQAGNRYRFVMDGLLGNWSREIEVSA